MSSKSYTLRMKQYGLSPARVRELKAFCEQYDEKKQELNDIYSLGSPPFDAPVQGGLPSNVTEQKAIRAQKLRADIAAIDNCLYVACEGQENLLKPMKKAITKNLSYYSVGITYEGRDGFYLRRRKFFYMLDQKLKER